MLGGCFGCTPDGPQRHVYFGYGAMCNPVSRQRRGIEASNLRAAFLPNFRIDFSVAGVANIVPTPQGPGVHGVLMEFESEEMWAKVIASESGYADKEVPVVPYGDKAPIEAHAFYMAGTQEENPAKQQDKEGKPQERYLKIIAQGIREHRVDGDYIQGSILGAGCVMSRKPDGCLSLHTRGGPLPTVPFQEYEKRAESTPCFLLHDRIVDLVGDLPADDQPLVKFLRVAAIGKPDFTKAILERIYDPDMPDSDQWKWAEDQCVDFFNASNMYELAQVNTLLDTVPDGGGEKTGH